MAVSIQIAKFKLCQYQWRANSPNYIFNGRQRYPLYGVFVAIITDLIRSFMVDAIITSNDIAS